jgi:hypothetical protein
MELRWECDPQVDAGVLELRSLGSDEALEFGVEVRLPGDDFASFVLHFDAQGRLAELEVFGVSKLMPGNFQGSVGQQ